MYIPPAENDFCRHLSRITVIKPPVDKLLTLLYCLECGKEIGRWRKHLDYMTHADEVYFHKIYVFGRPTDLTISEKELYR